MKQVLKYFLLILIANAFQKEQSNNTVYMADEEIVPVTRQQSLNAPVPPLNINKTDDTEKHEKKIIKDGRLGLKVAELTKTKLQVDRLVTKNGGYYANESFNNSDYESVYSLNIRIPSANFEKFISEIESGDGEVLYKEIGARDVTEQFIDLETRLKNKRNYLKRYNDLLIKATSISEIIEIEERIRNLEEEIESTTGRLKYLGDQVDYSTLNLSITKQKTFKYSPAERGQFFERMKQSLSKGWISFVDFSLFIIKLWPFWIIIYLAILLWRRYKRRKKNK